MRPAFASTKQAAAFAVMLLVLLLSPVLAGKKFLPPREEIYSGMTWRFGPFNYIRRQIFEEKGDIDIAFVGSSRLWAGVDTPYVQKALSGRLGRPATVLTLGWAWPGFDSEYFITQDLLQNRKVRMIVFDDEYWVAPHVAATHWFRFGENAGALDGLPFQVQAAYYLAANLGMPRNMLSLLRTNDPAVFTALDDAHWREYFHSQKSDERDGSMAMEGWDLTNVPFAAFIPHGNARPPDVCVYSPATQDQFRFTGPPTPSQQLIFAKSFSGAMGLAEPPYINTSPWPLEFAKKFAALAQAHGTKLVFLHLCPVFPADGPDTPVVQERECWPDVLGTNVTMMGIPPAKLFSGLSQSDIARLFFGDDHFHFNKNGVQFFTPLITPALLQIYETQAVH